MWSSPSLSRVWQPLDIGDARAKNRILVPARVLNWSDTGVLTDRHIEHYRELSRGGAAMIVTEQHSAYEFAHGSFYNPCSAYDYAAIPRFEKFAEAIAPHDTRGLVQLYGTGVHDKATMMMDQWHPLWGVSDIPSIVHNEVPQVMDKGEIATVVSGFARSARNVSLGGLDGVELHAAHGYLLGQFLSRAYNDRTDEYGGSVANRCRILLEIGKAIRAEVAGNLVVGVRLSYDEFLGDAGIVPDEVDEQLELLASTGLFDYFSISAGGYHSMHRIAAPMDERDGFLREFGVRAMNVVAGRAPVFLVGRVRDLTLAEELLATGAADMVAMGRAHLADPHIVNKTREGRELEITRCTGANECIGRLFDNQEVICMMNPVTGREARWRDRSPVAEDRRRNVLVVGGGPAGMKVAATAARQGHRVTLMEQSDALGGHLRLLSRFPHQQGWSVAVEDLSNELEASGAAVRLESHVDADVVGSFGAEHIFVATGSRYSMSGISPWRPGAAGDGLEQDTMLSIDAACHRALQDGGQSLGKRVVIYDEHGAALPFNLAEILARAGTAVHLVTPHIGVGHDLQRQLRLPWLLPELMRLGVVFHSQRRLGGYSAGRVNIEDIWGVGSQSVEDVATLVMSGARKANVELFEALGERGRQAERIGDCLSPRKLSALLYEGELRGRSFA